MKAPKRTLTLAAGALLLAAGVCAVVIIGQADQDSSIRRTGQRSPEAQLQLPRIARNDVIGRNPIENGEVLETAVVGRVEGPAGPIEGATVYAYSPASDAEDADVHAWLRDDLVGRASTSEAGTYQLTLPARSSKLTLDIGVVADAFLRELETGVVVDPRERTELNFRLDRGLAVNGRVVDEGGGPVAGLRLLATRKPGMSYGSDVLMSPALADTEAWRLARRGSDYHESRARTRTDGTFEMRGLAEGTYTLVAESYEWLLRPTIEVAAGDRHVLATAVRAWSVEGTVVDAKTRSAIERFFVQCHVQKTPSTRGYTCAGTSFAGDLRLAWHHSGAAAPPLSVSVRIDAQGYRSWHGTVELTRGRPRARLTAELEPLREATFRAVVRYDDGAPFAGSRLFLDYAQSKGGRSGTAILDMVGSGVYECALSPGDWFLRARPDSPLGPMMAWRGEITVRPGGTAHASVTLPRGGILRVLLPGDRMDGEEEWSLVLRGKRISSQTWLRGPASEFANMAPGAWELEVLHNGQPRLAQEIRILAGLTTEVRVP